jgi:hypothetical protein
MTHKLSSMSHKCNVCGTSKSWATCNGGYRFTLIHHVIHKNQPNYMRPMAYKRSCQIHYEI